MTHSQKRAVLVICDGQRRDMLARGHSPWFDALAARGTFFASHRSAFPSVTRCCSATIATGCKPARHGIAGNTVALPDGAGGFMVRNVGQPVNGSFELPVSSGNVSTVRQADAPGWSAPSKE